MSARSAGLAKAGSPEKTAKLFVNGGSQAVRLPKEFAFEGTEVIVRREGDGLFIRAKKGKSWPKGFFESIRISDSAFRRSPQGKMPAAVKLG